MKRRKIPYAKSKRTKKLLKLAHPNVTLLVDEVLHYMDIGVYETKRETKRQVNLFRRGLSQLDGITNLSRHQVTKENPLVLAWDSYPYKKGLNTFDGSIESQFLFYEMNWCFYRASKKLNIPIIQGFLWSFKDQPHNELV